MTEAPPAKTSGVVVPNKTVWQQRLPAFIIAMFIRFITATMRFKWTDRSGLLASESTSPVIYAIWHSHLALCVAAMRYHILSRDHQGRIAVMVSASKDGALLCGVFDHFGIVTIRGSTSRRGPQALRELKTRAREGYNLGLTPDGPRGPRHVAQDGAIALAQLTGLPIIPISFYLNWKYCLKSWDRFQVPLPFSRCDMAFEKPIRVPRDATPEQREAARLQLETALSSFSRE